MDAWLWCILIVICLVLETITLAMTTIWFACGGIAALIVSLISGNIVIEFVVFVVVSLACLFLLRPSVVRRFNNRREKTNVDAVVGKTVRVVEPVNNIDGTGSVSIGGVTWTARSEEGAGEIPAGVLAEVVGVQGVKVIIRKKEEVSC